MKTFIICWASMLVCIHCIKAQEETSPAFYLGGYFSFLVDPVIMEASADTINLKHFYINMNLRYALNYKWTIGTEYILALTEPDEVEDPFYLAGLTVDYNLLRVKRSKLHLRAGLSMSNMSFAGDYEPKKKKVINRVIGASYEFNVARALWIYAGYYNHYPLNRIPYKYSIGQPFFGAFVNLSGARQL